MTKKFLKSSRHWKLKEKAINLRKQGLSYSEINKTVSVSQSTISLWVRNVPLTKTQKKRLTSKHDFRLVGIKAVQTMYWQKRENSFKKGIELIRKSNKQGRYLAGLGLYWAEGNKTNCPAITNSDPRVIKFMVRWLTEFYNISPRSMVIQLHIHTGQNEKNMRKYWSRLTHIPLANFTKSFVKPEGSGYRKNIHYMGTAKVRVRGLGSTYLLFQILGSIAGFLQTNFKEKIEIKDWIQKPPYAV